MHPILVIGQLDGFGWQGVIGLDVHLECLCVENDGSEVFDAKGYMHLLLNREFFKVERVQSN